MASLFTTAEKSSIESCLQDVHDTFARDIYAFVEEAQSVGSNTNYNSLYKRNTTTARVVTDKILTKYTVSARIFYPKQNDEEEMRDINLPSAEMLCRIKVTAADAETINKASVIEVDGENYSVISDTKAIGPFRVLTDFMQIYLKRNT